MQITKDTKTHQGNCQPHVAGRTGAISWTLADGIIELSLHREPCNELGSESLYEFEKFATALEAMQTEAHALIIHSELKPGFCAGADLRELYHRAQALPPAERVWSNALRVAP